MPDHADMLLTSCSQFNMLTTTSMYTVGIYARSIHTIEYVNLAFNQTYKGKAVHNTRSTDLSMLLS